jgi:hypothetical protein
MDKILEEILRLEKELQKFPKKDVERIERVIKYTHKCANAHTQECCGQSLCKACYTEHVKTSHSSARNFLQKVSPGTLITARFNDTKGEEIFRSPEIQATSKGRIKCCGKFRSQNRHHSHCAKHHPGESQEAILKYKDGPETQRVSSHTREKKGEKIDPIKLLSKDQLQQLIREIQESQRNGKYYE